MDAFNDFFGKTVCVLTLEGSTIIGKLVDFDRFGNFFLVESFERIVEQGIVENVEIGSSFIRGDSYTFVALHNEEVDASIDWGKYDSSSMTAVNYRVV